MVCGYFIHLPLHKPSYRHFLHLDQVTFSMDNRFMAHQLGQDLTEPASIPQQDLERQTIPLRTPPGWSDSEPVRRVSGDR